MKKADFFTKGELEDLLEALARHRRALSDDRAALEAQGLKDRASDMVKREMRLHRLHGKIILALQG